MPNWYFYKQPLGWELTIEDMGKRMADEWRTWIPLRPPNQPDNRTDADILERGTKAWEWNRAHALSMDPES